MGEGWGRYTWFRKRKKNRSRPKSNKALFQFEKKTMGISFGHFWKRSHKEVVSLSSAKGIGEPSLSSGKKKSPPPWLHRFHHVSRQPPKNERLKNLKPWWVSKRNLRTSRHTPKIFRSFHVKPWGPFENPTFQKGYKIPPTASGGKLPHRKPTFKRVEWELLGTG